MKSVLVLGGSGFIGTAVVGALLRAGWEVTSWQRGTLPVVQSGAELVYGDRDDGAQGLGGLGSRWWDAVVDVCGYTPRQVIPTLERLARTDRYVYFSAVMAYGDTQLRPVRETHSLLPPAAHDVTEIDGDTYGPLKVACEELVTKAFGNRATIVRPQTVVGPGDRSGRASFWLERAVKGGPTPVPGDGSDHLQVLDVADLARFVSRVLDDDRPGVFHLGGPRIRWNEFVDLLGIAEPVWNSAADVPLYRPERGLYAGLMDLDTAKAQRAGFQPTPAAVTWRRLQDLFSSGH